MHLSLPVLFTALLTTTTLASPLNNPRTMDMGWSVRNFVRNCTDPNICTYHLTIDTGSMMQNCTTIDANPMNPMTNMPVPATTHALYDVPCKEDSDYHISWGWDYNADFTVMTVRNVMSNMDAFFGYLHPNAGLPVCMYADVGPNAVQSG